MTLRNGRAGFQAQTHPYRGLHCRQRQRRVDAVSSIGPASRSVRRGRDAGACVRPERRTESRRDVELRHGDAARTPPRPARQTVFHGRGSSRVGTAGREEQREPPPEAPRRGTGTYNTFYREFGTRTVATRRTSIVTEVRRVATVRVPNSRSEEHTSELQSLRHLVCRLLLQKNTTRWHSSIAPER